MKEAANTEHKLLSVADQLIVQISANIFYN